MQVVFTGPAFDGQGQSILRANLAKACAAKSIVVQSSIKPTTNILVASRKDTVKAHCAAKRGLVVVTYPEFIAAFLDGVEIATGGKPDRYADAVDKDLLVPDFTDGAAGLAAVNIL